ncbi:MAG: hypothetical protein A2X36_03070 [Elusimicrobia bacterium GWA2_69_24]|nr:MAG: hypothetical protein A2X36_03070 [Elusimicrobia bacterium GWA2_69_24]HBL19230.1 hypothetical protein [Elusimicrobiota bacterium]
MILKDKVAVITGGSQGIGLAIAEAFAREGAKLVLVARGADRLERACAALRAGGADAVGVAGDVGDEGAALAAFAKVRELHGRLDILVNNAGSAFVARLGETTLEQWNSVLSVHATGPFLMCREAVKLMVGGKTRGRIVNVASVLGNTGSAMATAYSAAKAALLGFSRALAKETSAQGITVNCICPGAVDTVLFHEGTIGAVAAKFKADPAALVKGTLAAVPLGRLIQPSEVAELALYLCSDKAEGITGQAYNLCGGLDIHS